MEKSTSSKHRDSLLGNYKRDYTVIKNGDHIPSGIASSSGTRKRKNKKNIIVTLAIDFFFLLIKLKFVNIEFLFRISRCPTHKPNVIIIPAY